MGWYENYGVNDSKANFREADCCDTCKFSDTYMGDGCIGCDKFKCRVYMGEICDYYKRSG